MVTGNPMLRTSFFEISPKYRLDGRSNFFEYSSSSLKPDARYHQPTNQPTNRHIGTRLAQIFPFDCFPRKALRKVTCRSIPTLHSMEINVFWKLRWRLNIGTPLSPYLFAFAMTNDAGQGSDLGRIGGEITAKSRCRSATQGSMAVAAAAAAGFFLLKFTAFWTRGMQQAVGWPRSRSPRRQSAYRSPVKCFVCGNWNWSIILRWLKRVNYCTQTNLCRADQRIRVRDNDLGWVEQLSDN